VVDTLIEPRPAHESASGENGALLRVENLSKHYPIRRGVLSRVVGHVKAVDGVSFEVKRGETLGLVGESGCGKTTLARAILRLTEVTGGEVYFDNIPVLSLKPNEMRILRKRMLWIASATQASANRKLMPIAKA